MKVFSSIKKMISIESPKKKAGRISICILITALIFIAFPAWSADYYIAQRGTGGRTSCSDAGAITWNWSGVVGGDTVHLCGTITSQLAIAKSGTSGHPITVKFETGAKFSAPVWSTTGAIYCTGQQYITIDGNNTGIIENTNNGSVLTNYAPSSGVTSSCDNIEIKGLTVQNIYMKVWNNGAHGAVGTGGIGTSGNNISIHDNIVNNAFNAINYNNTSGTTTSNVSIYNNTITRSNWGIGIGVTANSTVVNNIKIYNNDITIGSNWHCNPDIGYHMNGIIIFGNVSSSQVNNTYIYNNYFHGETSPDGTWYGTAFIFFCDLNGTGTKIFNNVLAGISSNPSPAYIALGLNESSPAIYNNTIIGDSGGIGIQGSPHYNAGYVCNPVIKNNIVKSTTDASLYYLLGTDITPVNDYNAYYGNTNIQSYIHTTLADWQGYLGGCPGTNRECNSITTNPDLNANYTPKVTSPVVGKGVNLTSLGITALNSDKNGVARPSSGAWDMGAYGYNEYNKPKTPLNLRINAQ